MWKGCLLWIAVYCGTVYVVLTRSEALALPYPWVIALAVGLVVTLALGTLQGLVDALRRRAKPEAIAADLRDGATVRLSGVLAAVGAPVQAPISGREAIYCTYSGHAGHQEALPLKPVAPHWRGIIAAPCVLRTRSRELRVCGVPGLRALPEQVFFGKHHHPAAARCLAATVWELSGDIVGLDVAAAEDKFAAAHADGGSPFGMHRINEQALQQLHMDIGKTTAEALLPRLAERNWTFNERVVPPGARVTLVGIYRANPPSLDVGFSVRNPGHVLNLGDAASLARRELVTAVLFLFAFVGVSAWLLNDLYRQDGRNLRSLVDLWQQRA